MQRTIKFEEYYSSFDTVERLPNSRGYIDSITLLNHIKSLPTKPFKMQLCSS